MVVGSCVGFLPHNWFPSKIFMGDSGAMLIGLLMASAGIVSTGQITSGLYDRANGIPTIIPILLPFAVLFLPLLDLGLAVVRRTALGRSPWSADRGHLHHKLMDIGYSHRDRRGADVHVDLHPGVRRPRLRHLPVADRAGRGPGRGRRHGRGDGMAVPSRQGPEPGPRSEAEDEAEAEAAGQE